LLEFAKAIEFPAWSSYDLPIKNPKRRALGFIARRFAGKSWATGEVMAPETALAALPAESFHFTVEGPATYERLTSLRN
jgi:hypothetical protein